MRQLAIFCIPLIFLGCTTNEKEQAQDIPDGTYRPSGFHAFINHGTGNDPISLVKSDSLYHLFYSTGTDELGHISSKDLLTWKPETSFSISSDNEVEIIFDKQNLTGSGTPWNAFIMKRNGLNLAYSIDGLNWNEFENNPVLKVEGVPSINWNSGIEQWILTISNDRQVSFFTSVDLKRWESAGTLNTESEIQKASLLSHEGQWFTIFQSKAMAYQLIDFDGEKFKPDGKTIKLEGMEADNYSVLSEPEGISLISGIKSSNARTPTFSTPLEISVIDSELNLFPVPSFKNQIVGKRRTKLSKLVTDGPSWFSFKIDQGFSTMEIIISDDNSDLSMIWDTSSQSLTVRGSAYEGQDRETVKEMSGKISIENLTVDILIDHATVDLFFNGGKYATSLIATPATFFSKVEVKLDGETYDAKGILYDIGI